MKINNKLDGLNGKIENRTIKEPKKVIELTPMEANLFNKLKQLRYKISIQEGGGRRYFKTEYEPHIF